MSVHFKTLMFNDNQDNWNVGCIAGGERKHEKAEPYIPQDPQFEGVFLILVGRAPAPVWEVERNSKNQITNLYRKKKWPYI